MKTVRSTIYTESGLIKDHSFADRLIQIVYSRKLPNNDRISSFYSYVAKGFKIYRDFPYYCYSGGPHKYRQIRGGLVFKIWLMVVSSCLMNVSKKTFHNIKMFILRKYWTLLKLPKIIVYSYKKINPFYKKSFVEKMCGIRI